MNPPSTQVNDNLNGFTLKPARTCRFSLPPANQNKPLLSRSLPGLTATVWPVTGMARLRILRRWVGDWLPVVMSGVVRRLAGGVLRRRHLLRWLIRRRGLIVGRCILLLVRVLWAGVHDATVLWTSCAAGIALVECRHRRRRIRPTRRRIRLAGRLTGRCRLIRLSVAGSASWRASMLVALVCLGVARSRVVRCRWSVARRCCCCWCQRSLSMLCAVSRGHLRQTLERRSSGILRRTAGLCLNTTKRHHHLWTLNSV